MTTLRLFFLAGVLACAAPVDEKVTIAQPGDGYRGIWYYNQPSGDKYAYKYSGGFATYPQQQSPIAIYEPRVDKTFFVYGGTSGNPSTGGKPELLHMVSYFDHKTGQVPRPTILLNKHTNDAHDNPVLSIDADGYLWIFSNAHGTSRPSYIHKSRRPFDITGFELIRTTNFSYGHIWHQPSKGFLLLHTLYENKGRSMYIASSSDGREWRKPELMARIELGQYQVTAHAGLRTASAFNMHPEPTGLNERTNLYYMETGDHGNTWRTVNGEPIGIPLRSAANPALVHDYKAEGLKVYLKDIAFDREGHPVILYLTSKGYESGPKNGLRQWRTARWTGTRWEIRNFTTSDHNYDHGALSIEADGAWRVIAPTDPGPQPYTTGGDMVMWISRDNGATWKAVKRLTAAATWNHSYANRPVNAHPDFYAFWADGDTLQPSNSRLYFTNKSGVAVWALPERMEGGFAKPLRLTAPARTK